MIKHITKGNQRLTADVPVHGRHWEMRCQGRGMCDSCRVTLVQGLFEVAGQRVMVSPGMPVQANACQTVLLSETGVIDIPERALAPVAGKFLDEWNGKPPKSTGEAVVAVDLGTTTVAAALISHGAVVKTVTAFNGQCRYGDNVVSRISMGADDDGRRMLQQAAAGTISQLLGQLGALSPARVVIAGNTVMTSLLWGIDTTPIGVSPYRPATTAFEARPAMLLGLEGISPQIPVHAIPAVGGYVGGDVTAGIFMADLQPGEMLVDIGTNCEMVFRGADDTWLCTASAAGPAFEGAGIHAGSRAVPGAIEHFHENWQAETLEHLPPTGICGSGMIDVLAVGRREGWLTSFGRLVPEKLIGHLSREDGTLGVEIAQGVAMSESDIEQLLKAKAAVYAGIQALAAQCDGRVSSLVLAGGFARYLDVPNAKAIGMLPDIPCRVIGNAALAGAAHVAAEPLLMEKMKRLATLPTEVSLNHVPAFEGAFIDALQLP